MTGMKYQDIALASKHDGHKSYFVFNLKPHAQFGNPTITSSGRKVTTSERRKKREKKTLLIVDS